MISGQLMANPDSRSSSRGFHQEEIFLFHFQLIVWPLKFFCTHCMNTTRMYILQYHHHTHKVATIPVHNTYLHCTTLGMGKWVAEAIPRCFQEMWRITEEKYLLTLPERIDSLVGNNFRLSLLLRRWFSPIACQWHHWDVVLFEGFDDFLSQCKDLF